VFEAIIPSGFKRMMDIYKKKKGQIL